MAANNDPRLPQIQFYRDTSAYDKDLNSALMQEIRDMKRDSELLRKKLEEVCTTLSLDPP